MYIVCITLCHQHLLCLVKDVWYSAHLNHLKSQRVVFYIIYFLKKEKKTSKMTLATNSEPSLQTVPQIVM